MHASLVQSGNPRQFLGRPLPQAAKPAAAKPGAVSTYNEAEDDEADSGAKQPLPEMALAGKPGGSSKAIAKMAKEAGAAAAAAKDAGSTFVDKKPSILVRRAACPACTGNNFQQ